MAEWEAILPPVLDKPDNIGTLDDNEEEEAEPVSSRGFGRWFGMKEGTTISLLIIIIIIVIVIIINPLL